MYKTKLEKQQYIPNLLKFVTQITAKITETMATGSKLNSGTPTRDQ